MLITVIVIVALSIACEIGITSWRKSILPSDTELFIDVISTFADGTIVTDVYSMDIEKTDDGIKFVKENDIKQANQDINTSDLPQDDSNNYISDWTENDSDTGYDNEPHLIIIFENEEDAIAEMNAMNSYNDQKQYDANMFVVDPSNVQTGTTLNVSRIQNGFSKLSQSDKKLYKTLGYLRYLLPIIFSMFGILFSCFIFYGKFIKKPILQLADATDKIASKNLDFSITSDCKNELGRLCDSFEEMRIALADNNKEMLDMIEERRYLQSSVAHDLRNPIAIMKGYLEMMESEIDGQDNFSEEFKEEIKTLSMTTNRMEEYVKSVSVINKLGDMELSPAYVDIEKCVEHFENDIKVLVKESNKIPDYNRDNLIIQTEDKWKIDMDAISRILENVISNACRYAESKIFVSISNNADRELVFEISDDGPGYPEKYLKNPEVHFYTTDYKDGHMGMGMTVCRIICKKHRGNIEISNQKSGGAKTKITLKNLA